MIVAIAACNKVTPPNSAKQHPNIILIYTDDQGYGDASCYNDESKFKTPNIDRIGNEGLIFTDGHCSDTVCTPSRYGLLTGRYSWRTLRKSGVMGAEDTCMITKNRLTLASLLKKKGYNTAMSGKWHLGMDFPGTIDKREDWSNSIKDGPIDKGFDYFFGIAASMNYGVLTYLENDKVLEAPNLWTKKKVGEAIDDYRMMPPYDKEKGTNNIEVTASFKDVNVLTDFTKKALDWLESVKADVAKGKPFFLYVPYTSPHKPVCPRKDFVGKSEAGLYGDFMIETDYHVGRILDFLDDNKLSDNTMVIFTSDNGPEKTYIKRNELYQHFSAGKLRGGKRDIYEGGHRVPFLIRWPAMIKAGRKCDEPVCQTDFLATFADILDIPLSDNEGEDSYSLYPSFTSDNFDTPLRGPIIHHSISGYFAIRHGPWKLNMFRGGTKPQKVKAGMPPMELYHLKDDLKESNNLYNKHPEKVKELTKEITAIVKNGRSTTGKKVPNDGPQWWKQLNWIPQP